jgi:hypothetical protein
MRSTFLFALACSLYADSTIQGPRLGYVSSGSGVRSVLGIVGASRLSEPIAGDLRLATVLPGTNVAIGVDADGELVRVDLRDGASTKLGVRDVTAIAASPAGERALALAGDRAYVFANSGTRVADLALPGAPLSIEVSDLSATIALTVAESNGEALYVVSEQTSRRLLHASRLPAIAFLFQSADLVVADDAGVISRVNGNVDLTRVTTVPGAQALAATPDGSRLLIVADGMIRAVRFATGEETGSVACKYAGAMAEPLGASNFLLTSAKDGPIWLVDASANELRIAFIPEAVNE